MENSTPTEATTEILPAHLDAHGRLMISVAELAPIFAEYVANHAALLAIEPEQDRRRAA